MTARARSGSKARSPAEGDVVATRGADWRIVRRLLAYLRPYRKLVYLQLTLMALSAGLQAAPTLIVREAIDKALPNDDRALLAYCVVGFASLLVLDFGVRYASLLAMMLTGQGVVRDLRQAVFARIQQLDQSSFDTTPAGQLMVRATNDVDSLEEMFASGVTAIIGDLFKLSLFLAIMLWLDVRLTVAALAVTPPFILLSVWFRARIRDAYRAVRAKTSRLNSYLHEVLQGGRVVRLFAREELERGRFGRRSDELLTEDLHSVRYDSTYSSLVEMLAAFALALVLYEGGGSVVAGLATFGTVYVFVEFSQQFFKPLQELSQRYATLQSAMASSERVFDLLDTPDTIRSPQSSEDAESPAGPGAVSFEGVTFAYPGGEPVLKNVSFDISPGKTVALVGATGSGKTTITRLLPRLHDLPILEATRESPSSQPGGRVLLDGVDVRSYPLDVLRRRVGVVSQEPWLFSGRVRDSLFLGEGAAEDERAWSALRALGADGFVERLGGLDATLRERGNNLSLGQQQLLTLARALLHDPAVLVLDEATASVDTLSERKVQRALATLMAGRTSLVVAHRLSTVRNADEILVMHAGELTERGSHEELLARDGLYARLHRMQLELEGD